MKSIQQFILILICLFSLSQIQAQTQHIWQTKDEKPQIRFNSDLSKMLVFTWDKISVWDTKTGEQISDHSPFIQTENRWPSKEVKLIDADANLNELVFLDNDNYYRFLLFMNSFSTFPKKNEIRNISFFGYVNNNDMAIRYYKDMKPNVAILQQSGELIPIKAKKFMNKSSYVTLDKKAVVLQDIDKYLLYRVAEQEIIKLPIKGLNYHHETLPDRWVEAYYSSRHMLQFYNYETEEKEFYKGSDGYKQFQPKVAQLPANIDGEKLVRATSTKIAVLEKLDEYTSTNEVFSAYGVKIIDRNTEEELIRIPFSVDQESFIAYRTKMEEQLTLDFKEFLINFEYLPRSFKFDYNSAEARNITSIPFVTQQRVPFLGDQLFAIGKLFSCADGGAAVLCMGFTEKGTKQTSQFAIFQFDGNGKLVDTKDLYATIRSSTGVAQVTNFSINSTDNFYDAHVKLESSTKAPRVSQYAGGCGQ